MDRAAEHFHQLVGALVRGSPVVGLIDPRDEAERRLLADQILLANRFCSRSVAVIFGQRAAVTWGPDGKSYVCEAASEQIARWAGFEAFKDQETWDEKNGGAPVWMGTRQTERGTFAAQFELDPQP